MLSVPDMLYSDIRKKFECGSSSLSFRYQSRDHDYLADLVCRKCYVLYCLRLVSSRWMFVFGFSDGLQRNIVKCEWGREQRKRRSRGSPTTAATWRERSVLMLRESATEARRYGITLGITSPNSTAHRTLHGAHLCRPPLLPLHHDHSTTQHLLQRNLSVHQFL